MWENNVNGDRGYTSVNELVTKAQLWNKSPDVNSADKTFTGNFAAAAVDSEFDNQF